MIPAVMLAGGASMRMGRPKAALPFGPGFTVLSRGVATLLDAGVTRVVVVAGAHPAAVRDALGAADARARVVEHPGWAAGQLTSLWRGMDEVVAPDVDALLVTLVDVPLVTASTVRAVIDAWRRSRALIVRPARGREHGHPVLFDRLLFAELRAADPAVGAAGRARPCRRHPRRRRRGRGSVPRPRQPG